jgi:flagellar biosynthetic protein FliR
VAAFPIPDPTAVLLVLGRIAGLAVTAPLFGHLMVPVRVRVGFVLVVALALAPVVTPPTLPRDLWQLAGAMAVETAVGALLGFVGQLIFAGVQLGGQIAGMQIGFGMANLVDPQSHAQTTVVAEWESLLALLCFLVLDVHHLVLRALVDSYRAVPAGGAVLGATALRGVVAQAATLFTVGVRIASPVLVVLLLANGALGVLARTIPQLNVFVVGFPLNVGAGLVVLGASLPFTFRFLEHEFASLAGTLAWLVRGVGHG